MRNKVKTVYIAGPITGDPKYRGKFSAAADMLMQRGYAVVNPVKMCWNIRWNPRYEVLAECFRAAARVNALALLSGWENSKGAKAELEVFQRSHSYSDDILFVSPDGKSITNKIEADDYRFFSHFYGIDYHSSCEEDEDVKRAIHQAQDDYKLKLNPPINWP